MSKDSHKNNLDLPEIAPTPSLLGEVVDLQVKDQRHDAVFGEMTDEGPNYRNVGWLGTTALMIKTQIGLGVLSIPANFHTLGIIPGVILLCVVGGITTWSNYIVGEFKLKHRQVYGIDDAGEMLFGRIGREVFGVAFCLFFTFVSGSAMLSISICLNALSTHAICTAIFVAIAAIITFIFSSIQTLSRISWLAWIGSSCIVVAVFTVTIAVGVEGRPSLAPKTGPWKSDYKLVNNPSFADAVSAITSMVFAYSGAPAFFAIASEMRDPRQYNKALIFCQTVVTVAYIVVGVVVYYYAGSYVASPALGTAGPVVKRVGYGIALPGLFASAILLTHVPSKYLFVRILRGSTHLTRNTLKHWIAWLGSTFSVSLVAYLIASGIPVFDNLVSLIGAMLGTFLAFHPMACMWLYDNWTTEKSRRTYKWRAMVFWCGFVLVSGTFLVISGTYGSIIGIIESYKGGGSWSCADNSNST